MKPDDVTAAVARTWVRCYSLGLPSSERQARLAEIESDLWEAQHDDFEDRRGVAAARQLGRVVFGVLGDVAWRLEHRRPHEFRRAALGTATALTILYAWTPQPPEPIPLMNLRSRPVFVTFAAGFVPTAPALAAEVFATRPRVESPMAVPDVSGVWTLDRSRSDSTALPAWDPRRTVGPSGTLLIEQVGERLARTASGSSTPPETVVFDLRGAARMDARGTIVRRATWAGRRLVLVITRVEKGGAWSTTDVLELAPDQHTLVVERVNQAGEAWTTYVGRVPDSARARTRDVFVRARPADAVRDAGIALQP